MKNLFIIIFIFVFNAFAVHNVFDSSYVSKSHKIDSELYVGKIPASSNPYKILVQDSGQKLIKGISPNSISVSHSDSSDTAKYARRAGVLNRTGSAVTTDSFMCKDSGNDTLKRIGISGAWNSLHVSDSLDALVPDSAKNSKYAWRAKAQTAAAGDSNLLAIRLSDSALVKLTRKQLGAIINYLLTSPFVPWWNGTVFQNSLMKYDTTYMDITYTQSGTFDLIYIGVNWSIKDVACDPTNGEMWFSGAGPSYCIKLASDGSWLTDITTGSYGSNYGITVSSAGKIFKGNSGVGIQSKSVYSDPWADEDTINRSWRGGCTEPATGNIYFCVTGPGDIYYRDPAATGSFTALGLASSTKNWTDIAFDSSGNLYGLDGGYLYKRTGNVGEFANVYTISDAYGITINQKNDFYVTDRTFKHVKRQVGGSGAFSTIFTAPYNLNGVGHDLFGNIYTVAESYVYKYTDSLPYNQSALKVSGGGIQTTGQLKSTIGAPNPPLDVVSAAVVDSLNADKLDGHHWSEIGDSVVSDSAVGADRLDGFHKSYYDTVGNGSRDSLLDLRPDGTAGTSDRLTYWSDANSLAADTNLIRSSTGLQALRLGIGTAPINKYVGLKMSKTETYYSTSVRGIEGDFHWNPSSNSGGDFYSMNMAVYPEGDKNMRDIYAGSWSFLATSNSNAARNYLGFNVYNQINNTTMSFSGYAALFTIYAAKVGGSAISVASDIYGLWLRDYTTIFSSGGTKYWIKQEGSTLRNNLEGTVEIDADNGGLYIGSAQDSRIYYNNTDMVFNSRVVGTGNFLFQNGIVEPDSIKIGSTGSVISNMSLSGDTLIIISGATTKKYLSLP